LEGFTVKLAPEFVSAADPMERAARRLEAARELGLDLEAVDRRPVTSGVLSKTCEMIGEVLAEELRSRDQRIDALENCVRGLVQIVERRRSSQSD
jgi:hypothetical protein